MRTAAILPVKRFASAKQRLGGSVAHSLRMQLAAAMVADVLAAVSRAQEIERTIVVTGEQSVIAQALALGALAVEDREELGQSAAVTLGVRRAIHEGFQRVLCIPGDCPTLEPAELDALLADEAPRDQVVIIPDRHGTGTNGLLLTPPDAIAPSFGVGSCERHRTLASQAGLTCRLERPSSLLLDIDTRADLSELRRRLTGAAAGPAAGTRDVLGLSAARADLLAG
jgi:2-phospho-L-lactate guanylyltransferase